MNFCTLKRRLILAVAVAVATVTTATVSASQQDAPRRFLIEFKEPAVAAYKGGFAGLAATARASGVEQINLQAPAVQRYSGFLQERQKATISSIQQRLQGLKFQRSLLLTLNGAIVEYHGTDDLQQLLAGMDGIKAVYPDSIVRVHLDASNALINSSAAWQALGGRAGAGNGVKVAVIDTGIEPDHAMFQDVQHSRPADAPTDDYCATVDTTFCNDKLIAARFYDAPSDLAAGEYPDSPRDFDGHGSHVAGIAVGNQVSATYDGVTVNFSGVAPGASLMVYKALYGNSVGGSTGTTLALAAALEDAMADGADVINNSWGSDTVQDPNNSYYRTIFENLDAAGILTVTSAGNAGPGPQTIGCPACIEEGIAVASTRTGRVFGSDLEVSGLASAITTEIGEGAFTITTPIVAPLNASAVVDNVNAEGCSAFAANFFDGDIALIRRGSCTFADKASMVQNAGGVGMVVFNTEDGLVEMIMDGATLPSVFISQNDATIILNAWQPGDVATINPIMAKIIDDQVDVLSGFSSRGPNADSTFLKPELAAPGHEILSAYAGAASQYAVISGTSMAAPHVAGAAALMLAHHGDLTPAQLKSVLMTSAVGGVTKDDGVTPADPFDVGSGRLNLANALATAITVDTPSLADNLCAVSCSFERTLTNLKNVSSDWTLSVNFADPNLTGTLSTESVTLAANGTASFSLDVNAAFAGEGWNFGEIVVEHTGGEYAPARLPIVIYTSTTDSSGVISGGITSTEQLAGQPVAVKLRSALGAADKEVTFSAALPDAAEVELVADSLVFTETLSTATSKGYDQATNTINWVGMQQDSPPLATIADAGFEHSATSPADLGYDYQTVCGASEYCDDVSVSVTLPGDGILFDGQQFGTLTVSSNGLIELGETTQVANFSPQSLPNLAQPNGLYAPLWADLEIGGALGGEIRLFSIPADANGDSWLVVEWHEARNYNNVTGDRYSFNVWLQLGTDKAIYNYRDVSANKPQGPVVVGVENLAGNAGAMAYFDSTSGNATGTLPVNADSLTPSITAGDPAGVDMDFELLAATFGTVPATELATTRNAAVSSDLTDLVGSPSRDEAILMNVTDGIASFDAVLPLHFEGQGALSLDIATGPANGTVTTNGLALTYTPAAGFIGNDSFSYRVTDTAGQHTTAAEVTVLVENQVPVARASSPAGPVAAGQRVSLDGSASSDPDGDSLTYSWQQTAGPTTALSSTTAASPSLTAPSLAQSTTLTYQLTVSDGDKTSTDTTSISVQALPRSSGKFGFWIALLLLPLVLRSTLRKEKRLC
ncbi:hypothetical protein IDSA_01260 [Pseudidiomarina salinarum]|uniref:Peptidase S8/S53 domain-containing protein n=1 Tax=Pseudidiomarina salinarum TaxID=435908 RepID=A0A094L9A5_9GAMM|nr:S8 family serine peptidase [Pseudidiomarina salinarum]KFZ31378.1 hypothetical protein IDSA_01260 [Pseudidiomarina salinarum]RUO70861.1 hypothetical protein CWI79_05310 [Pseudidiomarina salinarum]